MRRRLIVVLCLAAVPVLLAAFAWSTRAPSAASTSWLTRAEDSARHAGLTHLQCTRDGSTVDCTASNGSASYTIGSAQMNGEIQLYTSGGDQTTIDVVVPQTNP
jgi:hypothetical protein